MEPAEEKVEKLVRILTPGVWMPDDYRIGFQHETDLIETLKAENRYCSVCYSVTKDLGIFSRPDKPHPKESKLYLQWDVTLLDLIKSAEANCKFCCFMVSRFFNDPMYTFFIGQGFGAKFGCCHRDSSPSQAKEVLEAIVRTREKCEKYGNPRFLLIAQPDDYSVADCRYERLRFLVDRTNLTTAAAVEDILGYRRQIVIEISASEGSTISDYIKARPVNIDPGSVRSMKIAENWVIDCLENHEQCKSISKITTGDEATILPTRVIKILDDDNLRLVSGTSPGKYTILSYCWGGPQQFITTTDVVEARRAGFKTHQLPKSLQDAVILTKSLGLEYLWIDAVCILQDSPDDKDIELPKMPSYYRNAYLTICASGKSCDTGFLAPTGAQCEDHPNTGVAKDLLSMPYYGPNGKVDDIFFREENPYCLSDEPVSGRAWTYQERILSPRVLTYGGRLMWQCATTQKSEGGVQDWSFDSRSVCDREIKLGLTEMRKDLSGKGKDNVASEIPADTYSLWYKAVEEFCERDMTYPDDKFRAIAALANEFALAFEDEYAAGLWKMDFLRGLMWSTWPNLDVRKPEKWRSPSWSWASVESSVTYSHLPTLPTTDLTKVLSIQCTPKSESFPYGEVLAAVLEIRGPVFSFDLEKMTETLQKQYQMPEPHDSMEWRKLMMHPAKGHMASNEEWKLQAGSIFLVLLAEQVSPDDGNVNGEPDAEDISEKVGLIHGLVLTPTENNTYERVSSFAKLRVKGYLNLCNREETVRIV